MHAFARRYRRAAGMTVTRRFVSRGNLRCARIGKVCYVAYLLPRVPWDAVVLSLLRDYPRKGGVSEIDHALAW